VVDERTQSSRVSMDAIVAEPRDAAHHLRQYGVRRRMMIAGKRPNDPSPTDGNPDGGREMQPSADGRQSETALLIAAGCGGFSARALSSLTS